MFKKLLGVVFGLAMMGMAGAANATLIEDVNVGGILYDVTVMDGTCATLFNPCTSNSDFQFLGKVAADAAATALLTSINTSAFALDPSFADGCSLTINPSCQILIPYGFVSAGVGVSLAFDTATSFIFAPGGAAVSPSFTTFGDEDLTYATFALATDIPEPSTLLLFGVGLIGLVGIGRRRRRQAIAA